MMDARFEFFRIGSKTPGQMAETCMIYELESALYKYRRFFYLFLKEED